MSTKASQITRLTIVRLNRLFRRRWKKTSKLHVTGLCARNSPATGELPAQNASNAENVSIWWRHHVMIPGISSRRPRPRRNLSHQSKPRRCLAPGFRPVISGKVEGTISSSAILTHWGRDKMDAISQTTFSNAFSWMKIYQFRFRFHWRIQLTTFQHWFR